MEFTCGKKRLALTYMAESKSRSVGFYRLSKEGRQLYVSTLFLVDAVGSHSLTAAELVEDIECLPPLR